MLARLARRLAPASGRAPLTQAGWEASPHPAGTACGCCLGPACRCGCAACAGTAAALPSHARAFSAGVASSAAAAPPQPSSPSPEEAAITAKLVAAFPGATATVTDTSGGCGTMFQVAVAAPAFAGLSVPRQHLAVAAALADDIKGWHGWTCETRAA